MDDGELEYTLEYFEQVLDTVLFAPGITHEQARSGYDHVIQNCIKRRGWGGLDRDELIKRTNLRRLSSGGESNA